MGALLSTLLLWPFRLTLSLLTSPLLLAALSSPYIFYPLLATVLNIIYQFIRPSLYPSEPPLVFHFFPLVGSTIPYGQDPYKFFASSRAKHGDIFTFILLGRTVTVYLGTAGTEFVLNGKLTDVNAEKVYAPMTTPVFGRNIVYDCPNAKLMEQKKFVKFGLTTQALNSYLPLIHQEVHTYLQQHPKFKGKNSGIVSIPAIMGELTLFTAARCLQGSEVRAALDGTFAILYHDLDRGFSPINFLAPWAPLPHNRRRDAAQKKMKDVYLNLINKRRAAAAAATARGERSVQKEQDMLWHLMEECEYKSGNKIPDEEIACMMITLLMGGQHSSAAITSWALLQIAARPKLGEVLYLEQVADDIDEKRLLRCVVKETLRLNNSIHSLMRRAERPLQIGPLEKGWTVPEGRTLLTSPGANAREDRHFKDAAKWEPRRWGAVDDVVDETKSASGPYLPFGAGRHRCIGEKFAYLNIETVVSAVLKEVEIECLPGEEGTVPPTDYGSLFSCPKGKAEVRWNRRVPIKTE